MSLAASNDRRIEVQAFLDDSPQLLQFAQTAGGSNGDLLACMDCLAHFSLRLTQNIVVLEQLLGAREQRALCRCTCCEDDDSYVDLSLSLSRPRSVATGALGQRRSDEVWSASPAQPLWRLIGAHLLMFLASLHDLFRERGVGAGHRTASER